MKGVNKMKSKKSKLLILAVCFVMAATVFTGCTKKLTQEDVKYSDEILDGMIEGMNEDDYEKFSENFSDAMKKALNEEKFKAVNKQIKDKIGTYESKEFVSATGAKKVGREQITVLYKAKYSEEPGTVLITVTFTKIDDKNLVEGFYMKSPKLAEK